MSENPFDSNEFGAPLLPGGTPELGGTGPHGAYPDGSTAPGEPVLEDTDNVAEGDSDREGEDQHPDSAAEQA